MTKSHNIAIFAKYLTRFPEVARGVFWAIGLKDGKKTADD
jgi:hypothetical protein